MVVVGAGVVGAGVAGAGVAGAGVAGSGVVGVVATPESVVAGAGRVAGPEPDEPVPAAVDEVEARGNRAPARVVGAEATLIDDDTADDDTADDDTADDDTADDDETDPEVAVSGSVTEGSGAGATSSEVASDPSGDADVVGPIPGTPASRSLPVPPPPVPGRPAPDQAARATTSSAAVVTTAATDPLADR